MGMAASQARFLSLTARKSNTEYEGQQINQQRTALANESSNLYSQLSLLEVPTPPSTSDYYKTVYTFNATEISGTNTAYTLDEIYSTPDGDYAVLTYSTNYFQAKAETLSTNAVISAVSSSDSDESEDSDSTSSGYQITIGGTSYTINLIDASTTDVTSYLDDTYGDGSYYYTNADDDTNYLAYYTVDNVNYYLTQEQIESASASSAATVRQYTKDESMTATLYSYETNDTGRTTSITVIYGQDSEGNDLYQTYELTCTTVEDEDAYDQAMLDYEYKQSVYEKEVSDLNAKTEAIQQKDKTLELELKQLDTEQNAIATELDAVQKVVEDNVESTFKTFG